MSESVKRKTATLRSVRELYRKLSRRQRTVLWGGLGSLAVVCGLVWSAGAAQDYVALHVASGSDGVPALHRLVSRLDASAVAWREGRTAAGLRTLEVAAEDFDRARTLLSEDARGEAGEARAEYSAMSFLEPQGHLDARLRDANRRRIEQFIVWNENIQTARIVAHQSRPSMLRSSLQAGDGAAVFLYLKPGVSGLKANEADAIREMVRSGFGLRPENVTIGDNMGNSYAPPAANESTARALEREDRCRALIRQEIQALYAALFDASELQVGVMVAVSPARSSIEKKAMDSENSFVRPTRSTFERDGEPVGSDAGGFITATMRPIRLREDHLSVPFESYEKTLIDIPAGELKGVSIVVLFDAAAVDRVESVRRDDPSSTPVPARPRQALGGVGAESMREGFARREEAVIAGLLGNSPNVHVAVKVHPFRASAGARAPAAPEIAAVPAQGAAGGGSRELLVSILPPAAGVLLAMLVVGWLASRLIRRRRIPSAAPGDAWKSELAPSTALSPGGGIGGDSDWAASCARAPGSPMGVLGSVEGVNAAVRERPEVAASVLRLWLAQDSLDPAEGAARS